MFSPVKYNRIVRKIALIAAAVLLAACTKDIQNKDAVRGAVVDYLKERQSKTGVNMDLMQVDVGTLTFTAGGKEARADVMVSPKAGGGGMHIPYTLDRQGDKWVVRPHAEGGENPHGTAGLPALPPSHPPVQP